MSPNPKEIEALLKELARAEVQLGLKNSLNVFEAAGLERQETKHSRMLGFLLDPSNAHGLRAEVFKKLVLQYFEEIDSTDSVKRIEITRFLLSELGDLSVEFEWKNIDVLVHSERFRLVVAIENKIGAKESSRDGVTQLERYADVISNEARFSGYSRLFLFLTVEGEEPSDDRWVSVTHDDVLGYVQESFDQAMKSGSLTAKAQFFVEQYLEFIRRRVVNNTELEAECRDIYQRHKNLLDLIFEVVGSKGGVSGYAEAFAQETQVRLFPSRSKNFAYLPEALYQALPDDTLEKPWWGQKKPVLFWFYLNDTNESKNTLKLILQVGPMKDKDARSKLVDALSAVFPKDRTRKLTDQYTVIATQKAQIDAGDDESLFQNMKKLHVMFQSKMTELIETVEGYQAQP